MREQTQRRAARGGPRAAAIVVADHAGFCFGVKRALDLVQEAREGTRGPMTTLGELIHNPQVVAALEASGVGRAQRLEEVAEGTVVISSHGAGPELPERAATRGLGVLDATCPVVRKSQALIERLAGEGYQIVILGDRGHREVASLLGHAGADAHVVETPEEAARLPKMPRAGLVVQTTQEEARYREVVGALAGRCRELRAFNTICAATAKRQAAARALAQRADLMIVVGGRNSANTARLRQVCEAAGAQTHHIETADEIQPEWLADKTLIGVTAGASTPQSLIDEVVARLRAIR